MDKKQKAALNMAKFLKSQSLDLLGRFDELGLDDDTLDRLTERCELLHETAEVLHQELAQVFGADDELLQ